MAENAHDEFLELYRPIHTQFARYCSNLAYGLMDADDLVQETVLITLQRFHTVREKQKLLGYMIAVSNNIVRNHLRRKKFSGEYNEKSLRRLESGLVSPETALDIHHLHLALQQLPARDRESILLFEINGFSIEEIAVIQESTAGATKTRLSRAREKLRLLLDDSPSRKLSGQKEKKPARRFLPLIILPMNTAKVFETLRNLPADVPLDSVEKFVSTQVAGKVTLSAAGKMKMFLLKFHLNSILVTLIAAAAIATALVLSTGSGNAKASAATKPVQAGLTLPLGILDFNESRNNISVAPVDSPAVVQKDTAHAAVSSYSYAYSDSSGKTVTTFTRNGETKTASACVIATNKPGKTAKAASSYAYASNNSAFVISSPDTGFAYHFSPVPDSISPVVIPAMNVQLPDVEEVRVFCDPNNHDTLQQVIERALLADHLITDAHHYCFKINGSSLKVNGEKQGKDTWKRYKKLIEENSPNKVSHTFSYALCVDGEDTTMQLENYQH